jgi:hypothetical protein
MMSCPRAVRKILSAKTLSLGSIVIGLLGPQTAWAFVADTPITPHASPEVQSVLAYFSDIYGHKIISGQQENWRFKEKTSFEQDYLKEKTGKLPGLVAMDLTGYSSRSPWKDAQHMLVRQAEDCFDNQHVLVSFCWHWRPPLGNPSFSAKDATFDITRAVTPGTPEYEAVLKDMDLIAAELTILRDAHVPVLWRPLHEANGRWFWWGMHGPEPFKKMWRMMYEDLAVNHQLTNLIWVYSPGAETDLAAWYPGDAYVDILGQDLYPMDGNHGVARDIFDELNRLGGGRKLIALAENGPVPDPVALVKEKAGWLFFTTWSGNILTEANTPAQLHDLFNSDYVLKQGDLPDLRHYPFPAIGKPVKLDFHRAPTDVAVNGIRYLPLTVTVADKNGRTVREGNYNITVRLKSHEGGALSGTLTEPTVNGIATFADLKISAPGNHYRLIATAADVTRAVSPGFAVGPGTGPVYEWWTPFNGFTNAPSGYKVLSDAVILPVAKATDFAARIHGDVLAPETGNYRFWLDNENVSELWLSPDENATHSVKIAEVTVTTPYSKWPHTHEAGSMPVKLRAGQRYYFEVRQQQGGGSTQFALRWQLPDGTEERPVPGYRIMADDCAHRRDVRSQFG